MSNSKHKSSKKHHSHKSSSTKTAYTKEVLATICPQCGAWKNVKCTSTKTDEERPSPHPQRVEASTRKSSKSEKLADPKKEKDSKKESKNPLSKLTSDQRDIVEKVIDKVHALGKEMEFVGPVTEGPYITTYRFRPGRRTKVKHLEQMGADVAVSLGRESTLIKMMPGDSAVGVFVPNLEKKKIPFANTIPNVMKFVNTATDDGHKPIPLNFGMDHNGVPFVDDLTTLPHLLMAGSTGAGKSTGIRAIICSILLCMKPEEVKLIISDTKGVEFKAFQDVPHMVKFPTGSNGYCNDVYKTMSSLNWAVEETQRRYNKLADSNVQNIHQYNEMMPENEKIPYIIILIDELADLVGGEMSRQEAKINTEKIKTISARSRAAGIYLIAATQRPDVKTVVGAIKANFSARLSFRLPSHRDSSTILGTTGAQHLIAKGDMLYISSMNPALKRLHAPWTSFQDVKDVLESVKARANNSISERVN